ncbi:hypothetical protein AAFF_G00402270 [Aldrovandia affinis]|uniref:Uncharacterized protein n=1 Tax=Aldrovandia affinis TaxID=143900 RepID=A0AAD7T7A1_9TELE|nr:hypothetical protein AAFF_G00402270 [Aldrovandia affinis]
MRCSAAPVPALQWRARRRLLLVQCGTAGRVVVSDRKMSGSVQSVPALRNQFLADMWLCMPGIQKGNLPQPYVGREQAGKRLRLGGWTQQAERKADGSDTSATLLPPRDASRASVGARLKRAAFGSSDYGCDAFILYTQPGRGAGGGVKQDITQYSKPVLRHDAPTRRRFSAVPSGKVHTPPALAVLPHCWVLSRILPALAL